MSEMMRSGWQVRGLLFFLFATLVSAWVIFSSSANSIFADNPLQAVVVVSVITATMMVHWNVSLNQSFTENSKITLM